MALINRNQENNWAYVLVVLLVTAVASGFVIYYSMQTIGEINSLSATEYSLQERSN